MNLGTSLLLHGKFKKPFYFSRLLILISFFSVITIMFTACHKDENKQPPTAPIVTTAALTNITTSGATGGGSIVSDGGAVVTASGIVWSLRNATPTLTDSVVAGTTSNGTFTSEISGLDFNTTYYIRAFATNSVGTGYGDIVTLTTTNDTNKVKFTYNGEEVVYGIIVSPTSGRKWLDRNLGAQQVATALNDYKAYGDLFQWGRPADGHQLINWTSASEGNAVNGITATAATSDVPGNSNYILPPYVDPLWLDDWRDDNNRNRWATAPQGPCPSGWHVPTKEEWGAELIMKLGSDGSSLNGGTAVTGGIDVLNDGFNMLKLVAAGYRAGNDGSGMGPGTFNWVGVRCYYWTSSDEIQFTTAGTLMVIDGNNNSRVVNSSAKSSGSSVRCIKD